MANPEVPIDVDPESGIWRTDGLPMIYLPRHFLVNNHLATEAALGLDAYRRMLHAATEKSAITWCRAESTTHGLAAEATVRHYFRRLSQRGWGQFSLHELDIGRRRGVIALKNSVFVLEAHGSSSHPLCYMFEGFVTGAFRFLFEVSDASRGAACSCREIQCAAMDKHDHCSFKVAQVDL